MRLFGWFGCVGFAGIGVGGIMVVIATIMRLKLWPRTKAARDEYEGWMAECGGAHRVSSRSEQLHRRYLRLLWWEKWAVRLMKLAAAIVVVGCALFVYSAF